MRADHNILCSPRPGPVSGAEPARQALIRRPFRRARDWSKANGPPRVLFPRRDRGAESGHAELELAVLIAVAIGLVAVLIIIMAAWLLADVDLLAPAHARRASLAPQISITRPDGTIHPRRGGTTARALCEVRFRGEPFCGTPVDAAALRFCIKEVLPIVPRGTREEEA